MPLKTSGKEIQRRGLGWLYLGVPKYRRESLQGKAPSENQYFLEEKFTNFAGLPGNARGQEEK